MDKHLNVEKLFSDKLQNFEQETTPDFDLAMEKQIDRLHWPSFLKWIWGTAVVAGLATVIAFSFYSSDSSKTQQTLHVEKSEPTEVNQAIEMPSSQKEELVFIEEQMQNHENEVVISTVSISNDVSSTKKETDIDSEEEIYRESISIQSIESQMNMHLVSMNFKNPELDEKQAFSPTSLLDEELIAQEAERQNQEAEKRRLELEKLAEKERQQQQKWAEKQLKIQEKEEDIQKKRYAKLEREEAKETQKQIKQQEREAQAERVKREKEKARKKKQQESAIKAIQRAQEKEKRKLDNNPSFEGALEFSASPLWTKNLSPPIEPGNDTVTNWLTNKDFNTSYDVGLEFLLQHKESHWMFKTGLHYQKLSEEVNYYFLREYQDEALSHWIYDSIFEYHIDPPQFDTILVGVDSSYYEHWERSETAQKFTNKYQYLQIPLLLGYQIDLSKQEGKFKKGFDVHVLVGTGLGILLQSEGYHYDTDGYIYEYPSSQKATIDWYLHTQLAVNYYWRNLSFFAKPRMQFQMRKRPFDHYFENRHYLIYGVDFGVRVKIF
jgi:hypothetical protein